MRDDLDEVDADLQAERTLAGEGGSEGDQTGYDVTSGGNTTGWGGGRGGGDWTRGTSGGGDWTRGGNQTTTMGSMGSFTDVSFADRISKSVPPPHSHDPSSLVARTHPSSRLFSLPHRMARTLESHVRFLQVGADTLAKAPVSAAASASGGKGMKGTREMGDLRETWEVLAWDLEGGYD